MPPAFGLCSPSHTKLPPPSEDQWRALYSEDVHFQDPTQERHGIAAYLKAQEVSSTAVTTCPLTWVPSLAMAPTSFVEWEMGLKIKGVELLYPGTTRLLLNEEGGICNHRDYFDFIVPTFAPVPVLGGIVRWLYARFVF